METRGARWWKAGEGTFYYPVTHSEGAKGEALTCTSRYNRNWESIPEEEMLMQMDGHGVFKFAVKKVPEVIGEVLEKNGLTKEDIDLYVLHQANRRIVESVAKRMEEPIEKFPMNLQEYGNTSSASIPILLDELNRDGRLKKGQRIVIAGFGAGLSWGAAVIDWTK